MAIAPLCKICKERHWFHEPHILPDTPATVDDRPKPMSVVAAEPRPSSMAKVEKASSPVAGVEGGKFDRNAYQKVYMREYMRTYLPKWRARKKGQG